eukprot:TRINITY_DN62937_c0_g1_i1.p1 TRINITY_DN62937_c0_g1~~TRINITY_DN62937_c0_g1_i1.p1  ORF type:complete len:440 (-),score=55.60 TRINITY_DN62937_c0_g1_i1:274-1539(-)
MSALAPSLALAATAQNAGHAARRRWRQGTIADDVRRGEPGTSRQLRRRCEVMLPRRWSVAPLALCAILLAGQVTEAQARHDEDCEPDWLRNSSAATCPYGTKLLGDITSGYPVWRCRRLHGEDQPCRVAQLVNAANVVISYMPFVVIAVGALELVVSRGTRELLFLLFVALTSALGELAFKRIVSMPRPVGSCNVNCGMPSSHATFSVGFFVLMLLDCASRVNPIEAFEAKTCWRRFVEREMALLSGPLSKSTTLSNQAFVLMIIQWALFLLPVPISRVILHDHTTSQICVGAVIGTLEALLFYYGVYLPFAKAMRNFEDWQWPRNSEHPLIRNNIRLPWWCRQGSLDSCADDIEVTLPYSSYREDGRGNIIVRMRGLPLGAAGGPESWSWAGVVWPVSVGDDSWSSSDRWEEDESQPGAE